MKSQVSNSGIAPTRSHYASDWCAILIQVSVLQHTILRKTGTFDFAWRKFRKLMGRELMNWSVQWIIIPSHYVIIKNQFHFIIPILNANFSSILIYLFDWLIDRDQSTLRRSFPRQRPGRTAAVPDAFSRHPGRPGAHQSVTHPGHSADVRREPTGRLRHLHAARPAAIVRWGHSSHFSRMAASRIIREDSLEDFLTLGRANFQRF